MLVSWDQGIVMLHTKHVKRKTQTYQRCHFMAYTVGVLASELYHRIQTGLGAKVNEI